MSESTESKSIEPLATQSESPTLRELDGLPRTVSKPFKRAMHQPRALLDREHIEQAASLYRFLTDNNRIMRDNRYNNQLLANLSLNAVASGELPCWRFVCLPQVKLAADNDAFKDWQVSTDNSRFDTLTRPLERDAEILDGVRGTGVKPTMTYFVDDWEAPVIRNRQAFYRLPIEEQERAVSQLTDVRDITTQWIQENTEGKIPADIVYVSDLLDFDTFVGLLDPAVSGIDPNSPIIRAELDFVNKTFKSFSDDEKIAEAIRRVSQYAVEGAHMPVAESGLYLNAEYPIQQVWKKLTLIAKDIPTLFYVEDTEVKNV